MKTKIISVGSFLITGVLVFCLAGINPVYAAPQDTIQKAAQFYNDMDYDAAIQTLDRFVKANKTNKDKYRELSEAHYLLAKIYFEVGEDFKIVDKNLHMVFTYSPSFNKTEVNPDFEARVAAVKKKVDIQHKTTAAESPKKTEPKKPEPKTATPQPKPQPQVTDSKNNIFPIDAVDVPPTVKSRPHLVLSRRIHKRYRNQRIFFIVDLLINEKGKVKEIKEVEKLDKFIEKEMIAYLKGWRFIAASKDGKKVKTWKRVTVEFHVTTETRKQFRKN